MYFFIILLQIVRARRDARAAADPTMPPRMVKEIVESLNLLDTHLQCIIFRILSRPIMN